MNLAQKISIIGSGWLGLPLALHLRQKGHAIHISTTTPKKLPLLSQQGLTPYLLPISTDPLPKDHPLFQTDILIVTLPFKRTFSNPKDYTHQFQSILNALPSPSPWIIMTSSTSAHKTPPGARELALQDTENLVLGTNNATILRLGGLYGATRQIGKFLSGKSDIPDGPANLIHLDDVIGIIDALIDTPQKNQLFSVVSDTHPLKSQLYTKAAQKMGLAPPTFLPALADILPISNTAIKTALQYKFIHPNPMEDI